MKLYLYLKERKKADKGFTRRQAAVALNISPEHLSNLTSRSRTNKGTLPSLALAVEIEKYTDGVVCPKDWFN